MNANPNKQWWHDTIDNMDENTEPAEAAENMAMLARLQQSIDDVKKNGTHSEEDVQRHFDEKLLKMRKKGQ